MFNNREMSENKIYKIQNWKYKAQTIYSGNGTQYNIFDNPNGEQVLFAIRYWSEITPIEIIKIKGITWVKIKTREQNYGWLKSHFIEFHR
jgi:hypothetical protein